MQEYNLEVAPEEAGRRLDLFIMEFFQSRDIGFSRTAIQKLILSGKVALRGQDSADAAPGFAIKIRPHYKVKMQDKIKICIEEKQPFALKAEDICLDIVYEDPDLAVIDKPSGLVVHPAPGNYEHTLANAMLFHFKELSDVNPGRPGIVHRLDKDTSGILVIAKNNFAHLALAKQFAQHTTKRKYVALVRGRVEFNEQIIELPIGRHPRRRKNMSVGFGQKTRYAKTYYRVLQRAEAFSLLELEPFTGRTHQLRVHLSFLGHPVLGDTKYGRNNDFIRLALHAKSIGFIHPRRGESVEFSSKMPKEFVEFLSKSGLPKE